MLYTDRLIYILVLLTFFSTLTATGYSRDIDDKVKLVFTLHQERDIYDKSAFGEPPQFAIWLEDDDSTNIKTVFVTNRTGTGEFEGKIECPVALPIWIGVFRKETGRDDFPRPWEPFYDGVTGATPKNEEIELSVEVPKGVKWFYFLEMNVSGDYNRSYPYSSSEKQIDNYGNGQPSLIYKGEIFSKIGETSKPALIGRSEQYYFTTRLNRDLEGIDSAKEVFLDIAVRCK